MEEIFDAFAPADGSPGHRKILVRSCNGAGKTTALAAICNWYFTRYSDSIVLTTASSWMQVKRNLWSEIRRQAREGKLYPQKKATFTDTSITLSDKHFMIGISPNIPENAMGFHARHILIAVDEATGVDREIMDALMGNLTGADAQIVMICNPIDKDSFPYQAERSGDWKLIHISAFDHPNVVDGIETIPGAVTREWIADRLRAWSFEVKYDAGEFSRMVNVEWLDKWYRKTAIAQARILGEWAQLDVIGFIPLELIQRNLMPTLTGSNPRPKVRSMGVDISRGVGADATVYAFFDIYDNAPDLQLPFKVIYDEDLMATADRIKCEFERCKADGIHLIIAIDDTGLGGGVTDKLKRESIDFHPVNFNHRPKGFFPGKDIANARAEMYFVLQQELIDRKLHLMNDTEFHQELSSIRLDISQTNGSFKMEDKADIRQRLGRSPDYADATALARYALRLEAIRKREKLL